MSFAKVTIVGNLGRDPETRYTQNGTLILSFTIAARGRRKGGNQEPGTTWFRVSAFGEQAERLATMVERGYITKGKLLYVEGQLEESTYTGNDGQERKSLEVNLSDWQFIGSNQQDGQRNQGGSFGGNQGGSQDSPGPGRTDSDGDVFEPYPGSKYNDSDPAGDMNDVPF